MKAVSWLTILIGFVLMAAMDAPSSADEYLNGIEWKEPAMVKPGEAAGPPSDAVVLFDGTDLSAWDNAENWKMEEGAMVSGKGDVRTKATSETASCTSNGPRRPPPPAAARAAVTAASF